MAPFEIAGKQLTSRLLLGTGKFSSDIIMASAIQAVVLKLSRQRCVVLI